MIGEDRKTLQEVRVQTICLLVFAAIGIAVALYYLRPVLLPFVMALFLASGIAPILQFLERRLRAPKLIAVVLTVLLGLGLLSLVSFLLWASVSNLTDNADKYRARLNYLLHSAAQLLPEPKEKTRDAPSETQPQGTSPVSPDSTLAAPEGAREQMEVAASQAEPGEIAAPNGGQPAARLPTQPGLIALSEDEQTRLIEFVTQNVSGVLLGLSSALMAMIANATMVMIFLFFLLLGGTSGALPKKGVWSEIDSSIRDYIVTKTMISLFTGLVFGLVLWLFGVPMALLFGMLAFLLNFIPNIGPIVACLLPLPLVILNPDMSWVSVVAVIVLTNAIQFVSGNVVEPRVMGNSFELHPIAILLALMFWGMIWGVVGMFLATPMTAAAKVLFDKFDRTRPVAHLLAGRLDLMEQSLEVEIKPT